jgi:hypothetical protein
VKYVLDTNVVSRVLDGDERVLGALSAAEPQDVGIPLLVLAELLFGAESRRAAVTALGITVVALFAGLLDTVASTRPGTPSCNTQFERLTVSECPRPTADPSAKLQTGRHTSGRTQFRPAPLAAHARRMASLRSSAVSSHKTATKPLTSRSAAATIRACVGVAPGLVGSY